jgi:hypothetical protein
MKKLKKELLIIKVKFSGNLCHSRATHKKEKVFFNGIEKVKTEITTSKKKRKKRSKRICLNTIFLYLFKKIKLRIERKKNPKKITTELLKIEKTPSR